ncbi:helix-turn-helix domain-containing protein [Haloglycomyces albus]|uniref:helix-turn-helix domain-containing protein n=1 Tax=Haloglycomyces albus TaxID=526067 RepID=UPI00046C9543|nr:helix-turn-helix domain-containing protein [Haloglycomyces albus]
MTHLVKRRYEYTFTPNSQQVQNLNDTLGAVRVAYNWALQVFKDTWRKDGGKISYTEISAALTTWKNRPENAWIKNYSSVPLQQIVRQLHTQFHAFTTGRGEEPAFADEDDNLELIYSRAGYYLKGRNVKLAKHEEPLDIDWGTERPERDDITSITVVKVSEREWRLRIVAEEFVDVPRQKPPECSECGRPYEMY